MTLICRPADQLVQGGTANQGQHFHVLAFDGKQFPRAFGVVDQVVDVLRGAGLALVDPVLVDLFMVVISVFSSCRSSHSRILSRMATRCQ